MIDRTGQVWRKTKMHRWAPFDMVILRSSDRTLSNEKLEKGTNHIVLRTYPRLNNEIEINDWFEGDDSPWEENSNLVRFV